ncbi:hypothetical protein [Vibrio sp. MA40-2]|uniref:hypothetical protein n=1 Tax=Vibrio sp. MA40-2 TaxID=3391828 RepID=UPI0039A6D0A4
MTESLLALLAPMLLGAQLVLTLVLVKGEICPGQRGRVHKLLPAIGVLWLSIVTIKMSAFIVACAIFYFFSKVQISKTRNQGPLWVLYLADLLAFLFVAMQASVLPTVFASIEWVLHISLLGAILAQLLLLIARSRLQAFHRVLPVIGIVSSMSLALVVALHVIGLEQASMDSLYQTILIGLACLLVGSVVWCWHLVTRHTVNKVQLSISLTLLLLAGVQLYPLISWSQPLS